MGWMLECGEELNVLPSESEIDVLSFSGSELPGAKQPSISDTACCIDGGVPRDGAWLELLEEGSENGESDWLDWLSVLLPVVYLDASDKACDDWGFTCREGDVAVNVE